MLSESKHGRRHRDQAYSSNGDTAVTPDVRQIYNLVMKEKGHPNVTNHIGIKL